MKRILLSILLLTPLIAQAEIYRMVDSDGHVIFTDKPQPGASKVSLPPLQSYSTQGQDSGTTTSPLKPTASNAPSANPLPASAPMTSGSADYYKDISIASPADQATIQNSAGHLEVSLALSPDLRSGDKVMLTVDDEPVAEAAEGNVTFKLEGIPRGTHKLQAFIMGPDTHILKNSSLVTIFMHQASVQPAPTPPPAKT